MRKTVLERAQECPSREDERSKPARRASLRRHACKCSVCKHPDRESIDHDYLRWVSPKTIAREYGTIFLIATDLLETPLSHRKQRTAVLANRNRNASSGFPRFAAQNNGEEQDARLNGKAGATTATANSQELRQILIANSCKPKMAHLIENKGPRPVLIANFEPTACADKPAQKVEATIDLYPAFPRWANLCRASGAHFAFHGNAGEQSIFTYDFVSCNIAFVKTSELLGQAHSRDGSVLKLVRRGDEYIILANGRSLMSSRMHGSEEALATFACRRARALERPSVLVGGLGMGFTLRATLDLLPADARVVVAEIVPAVVEWNRGPLGPLAGQPLADVRVAVEIDDVAVTLSSHPGEFDAVLLDVDNGPAAFSGSNNAGLYDDRGIAAARSALKLNGVLAVWSAREDRKFEQRLRHGRFDVEVERVRGRLNQGGPRHTIFLGHKSPGR